MLIRSRSVRHFKIGGIGIAWLAVDSDKQEYVFENRPIKRRLWMGGIGLDCGSMFYVRLPKGSIKKLIGRDLQWEDDPVELK